MEYLAKGVHSEVFSIGKDRCVKACYNGDPWPEYINWADKHGYMGNFAPLVYGINFQPVGKYCYTALMERLIPLNQHVNKIHNEALNYWLADPSFRDFKHRTWQLAEKLHYAWDAGFDNMMFRASADIRLPEWKRLQLVITDPFHRWEYRCSEVRAKWRPNCGVIIP